jgi:1-acyl-sn-glycerol-3-phosphate acyltransferase
VSYIKLYYVMAKVIFYLGTGAMRTIFLSFSRNKTRDKSSELIKTIFSNAARALSLTVSAPKIKNMKLDADRPYIFICNHISLIDIVACYVVLPVKAHVRMIAKKELKRIPIFGWGMKVSNFIFIDRANSTSAKSAILQAADKVNEGFSVLFFAEGTRSKDGKLKKFKNGAFILAKETEAILVPLYIRGTNRVLPKGSWHNLSPGHKITIDVGETIDSRDFPNNNIQELKEVAHSRLQALEEKGVQD